jgi:hypothetical protein
MAIYYPDILEHNNSNYPLLDPTFLKGTAYPLASISTTGSIPADKRNVGMIVFDSGSGKFYGYKGSSVSSWATASNWIEFGSGSGGGSTWDHLFDRCIVDGFTYEGYNAGGIGLQFIPTGSTLNALVGDNLGYKVGDKIIVYIDDKNYVKGTVNQVPGGFGTGSINILVETVIGTANSDNYCITLDLTADSYVYATQTGSFLYSGSYNSATSALTLYSRTQNYSLDLSGLAGGGGGGFPITASNEGSDLTNSMSKIDFVGNAVTATNVGSAVTVTINTGSASTTDITALNSFTGSANTRLGNLEAATGSFYYSSSINSNVITFNQADGTTESITIVTVPSASYAPNIYNTDSTLTGNRAVGIPFNTFLQFRASNPGSTFQVNSSATSDVNITNLPTGISSSLLAYNTATGKVIAMGTSSIQNVVSASFASTASSAPNIYNSDGTITVPRVVTLEEALDFETYNGNGAISVNLFQTGSFSINYIDNQSSFKITNLPTQTVPRILGLDSNDRVVSMSTSSIAGSGTTNTGSLLVTGSVTNATLTFTKGNGTTFPLTVNNVANATTAGSVTSDSVYAEAGTDFDVWSAAGSTFTLLDVNSTNIEAIAPKNVEDGSRIFAVATMEVYRGTVSTDHTAFQCRLYNSTQTAAIPGSTRTFSSYLQGSGEGPIPTTFTFTVPISSDVSVGDVIELQVRQSPAANLGTYSSASISYADLALISITD